MEHKRVTLFAGHYGSGKTNIAVNYALLLAEAGKRTAIGDLDIVNPYFRTKDSAEELHAAGVELISPPFANSNVDLPALPAEAYRLVEDRHLYAVLDVGGDDRGAYALGRYTPYILEENNFQMAFVANPCRPLTKTPGEALEVMREIEAAGGIPFTALVNNANLAYETTPETVLGALPYMEELSRLSGLPVWMTTAEKNVAAALEGKIPNLLPMTLQKKYFDLPEQKAAAQTHFWIGDTMLPVEKISSRYTVRRLTEEDLPALLTLCRGNPQYYAPMHTEPALENLRRDMTALPPKKGMEDKYFLGLFQGDALLAVLDLILRYPNPETAFVGWLMLERSLQGGGTGTGIVTDLLDLLREWGFRWVRLGYVKGNPQSRRFWEKNGFAPTGVETDGGGYTIVVMERALCSGTEIGKSLHRKEIAVWQK